MRKKILLFCSIAIATASIAQDKPSIGIRAGVSSASMKGDAVDNLKNLIDYTAGYVTTNNHTGFYGGGYVSVPVSNNIIIEPAVYYTQKGYELNGELNIKGAEFIGANAKAKLTSHYIDVPVLIKGNFNGFQVFAGPQISYLAQADLNTKAGIMGFNVFNQKMDATEQLNRWDAGITGGVGYQFKNGFNVTAAYDHGLSKADANQNFESYNRSFKVGVGFSF